MAGQAFDKNRPVEIFRFQPRQFAFDVLDARYLHHVGVWGSRIRFDGFDHAAFDRIGGAFFRFGHYEFVINAGADFLRENSGFTEPLTDVPEAEA